MDIKLLELYSDYIISSFGQITATELARELASDKYLSWYFDQNNASQTDA